jgi:hypothetical protein
LGTDGNGTIAVTFTRGNSDGSVGIYFSIYTGIYCSYALPINKGIPFTPQASPFKGSQWQFWLLFAFEITASYALLIAAIIGIVALVRYRRLKKQFSDLQLEKGKVTKNFSELKDVKIFERLGGGNFGVVYRGIWQVERHNKHKYNFFLNTTPVALKKLRSEEFADFIHEADTLQ